MLPGTPLPDAMQAGCREGRRRKRIRFPVLTDVGYEHQRNQGKQRGNGAVTGRPFLSRLSWPYPEMLVAGGQAAWLWLRTDRCR